MSRLINLTVDEIKSMNNSELLSTLEVVRSRIGSSRKSNKAAKPLEKTFCYLDNERQRRVAWGMLSPKERK
jgi:hypothetical protein